MNYIVLHGYLGHDPELKSYGKKDGSTGQLANFSIGVSRSTGDETDWFNCTVFGKRAEVIDKYFHKGSQIVVSGRVESSKYEKNGTKLTSWKVLVDDFDFCDKKESGSVADRFHEVEEEIPF